MPDKPDTLHQKLLAVQKSVTALSKDDFNPHHKYKFVSSTAVLAAFRTAMDEQGLLLLPTITGTTLHLGGAHGGKMNLLEIDVEFVWVNCDNPAEQQKHSWYCQGIDSGEQAVGKALTYAEKCFLLKCFHIGTDDEDPDASERPQTQPAAQKQEPAPLLGDTGKAKFFAWLEDKPEPVHLAIIRELPEFLEGRWHVDTVEQVPMSAGPTLTGWAAQVAERISAKGEDEQAAEFFKLQEQAQQMGIPTEGLGTAAELREQIAKVDKAKGDKA